jgi:hypothetical protein
MMPDWRGESAGQRVYIRFKVLPAFIRKPGYSDNFTMNELVVQKLKFLNNFINKEQKILICASFLAL